MPFYGGGVVAAVLAVPAPVVGEIQRGQSRWIGDGSGFRDRRWRQTVAERLHPPPSQASPGDIRSARHTMAKAAPPSGGGEGGHQ
jgi:hypothetical protein